MPNTHPRIFADSTQPPRLWHGRRNAGLQDLTLIPYNLPYLAEARLRAAESSARLSSYKGKNLEILQDGKNSKSETMTMAMQPIQLSGIVRGKTILLEGELGLPDGAQVSLTVTVERVPNAKTAILARSPSELLPEVWDMVDTAISEWDQLDRERERDKAE